MNAAEIKTFIKTQLLSRCARNNGYKKVCLRGNDIEGTKVDSTKLSKKIERVSFERI